MKSRTYATLTKQTFPSYFKSVLVSLVDIISTCHMHQGFNLITEKAHERDMETMVEKNIEHMQAVFEAFKHMLECVKHSALQTKTVLQPTFKFGGKLIDAFQKKCMPVLEAQFRIHRTEIVGLMKVVQNTTKSLQRLCSLFKDEKKDEKLTAFVPGLKRSLETLLFRTKAMLAANNMSDAFWIGNLKNKDFVKGKAQSSQVPLMAQDSDDDGSDTTEDMSDDDA